MPSLMGSGSTTYATLMAGVGAGLGLPIIGKLLGDHHAETTARYAHLDADSLRKASNRIAETILDCITAFRPVLKRNNRRPPSKSI
jgi:hypothetical protein